MKKTPLAAALCIPFVAGAATVNLGAWAYGDSWANVVDVTAPAHVGAAGGFKGAVAFASGGEQGFTGTLANFTTYCVEIDEAFTLPSGNMANYAVVAGASYAKWNDAAGSGRSASAVTNRLGQLLAYVGSDATLVDTKAESTSLQLAIWNVVYDHDFTVTGGNFREQSGAAFDAYADTLLRASANYGSMLDVYVLSRDGSQDFVLTRDSGRATRFGIDAGIQAIPEPASLALVAVALGAAGVARRRRG